MNTTDKTSIEELLKQRDTGKSICFVSGNFNIIHPGHIRFLLFAAEQAEILIVGLHDKEASIGAYFDNEERQAALEALSFIDGIALLKNNLQLILEKIRPDVVVKGKEFEKVKNEETKILQNYGGKLIFSSGEKQFSSRELLSRQNNEASEVLRAIQRFHQRYDLDKALLIESLNQISDLNVAVIGDSIVDEYQECLPIGMSQEDPTIAVSPLESFKFIGGAGIVAAHAASLGAAVDFYSVIGNDTLAKFANSKFEEYNVNSFVLNDSSRPTTHKLRYRAKDKTLLRVNNFRRHDISSELVDKIEDLFKSKVSRYDLVIFSDFSFGVTCPELINRIQDLCVKANISMVADSQTSSQIGDLTKFRNLLLTTPTEIEARQAAQDDTNGLIQVSSDLADKLNTKNLIVTLGAEGVLIRHRDEILETDNLPAFAESAVDTAGAGDAFLVTASLVLKTGLDIWRAAFLGNIASSVQVNIKGNVPLTREMINFQLDKFLK